MDSDPTIKIAINRLATGKLPQGDSRWGTFNDSFINQTLEPLDIANAIYTGHAYTGWHSGRRCTDNFILSQHIAVDMDTQDSRSSFDVLRQHEFFLAYGGLLHTTPSHTPEMPKCRVLFLLDEPITDTNAYQAAVRFVISLFPGADPAPTSASSFFYGAHNCELEIPFNVLPLAHLRHYYTQHRKRQQIRQEALGYQPQPQARPVAQAEQHKTPDNLHDILLQRAINDKAPQEGRNNAGLWLACQLRDNAYSQMDAERVVSTYAASVGNVGSHPYTEQEALKTLHGAYSKSAREPWQVTH